MAPLARAPRRARRARSCLTTRQSSGRAQVRPLPIDLASSIAKRPSAKLTCGAAPIAGVGGAPRGRGGAGGAARGRVSSQARAGQLVPRTAAAAYSRLSAASDFDFARRCSALCDATAARAASLRAWRTWPALHARAPGAKQPSPPLRPQGRRGGGRDGGGGRGGLSHALDGGGAPGQEPRAREQRSRWAGAERRLATRDRKRG